jgi:type II secretory pathway pseudopilin PulG
VHAQAPDVAPPRDEGMTLVEVVVAFALFAVLSSAVLATLVGAARLTDEDQSRMVASDLAARELEITRDSFTSTVQGPDTVTANLVRNPHPLPGGTAGAPLMVNKVPFTVERTAQWAAVDSAAASTCDEGTTSELAYLKVKVTVRWPELGDRPPVEMNTVMTPPKGTYSSFAGHIGLKVIDAAGRPQKGVPVTAQAASGGLRSGTTAADGCVLLSFVPAGSYSVRVSSPGFVTPQGDATGSMTAQVQAGQLWKGTIEYDRAATVTAVFSTADGFSLPPSATNTLPVLLGNAALLPSGSRTVTGTGSTRTITPLWPYPSGYQLWAGRCLDNDPQHTGQGRELPVAVAPGEVTQARVVLAPVTVQGPPATAVRATAVLPPADAANQDPTCPASSTPTVVEMGSTGPGGQLKGSLPYGRWRIEAGATATTVELRRDTPTLVVTP